MASLWLQAAAAAPVDSSVALLQAALGAYHRGPPSVKQQLFPDPFIQLLDRLCGEQADSSTMPAWLDSIDFCLIVRYKELLGKVMDADTPAAKAKFSAELNAEFPPVTEGSRAEAARFIVDSLLKVLQDTHAATDPAALLSLFSVGAHLVPGRQWGAPCVAPVPVKARLLPHATQRLLAATRWTEPTNVSFEGGLCADPLLHLLSTRFPQQYGSSALPHPGSTPSEVARATADRTAIMLAPKDALLLYVINYRVSRTRRSGRRGLQSLLPPKQGSDTRDCHYALYAYRPLAYAMPVSTFMARRPYNEWLWSTCDMCAPSLKAPDMTTPTPSSSPFPPPDVPEADLFFASILAYWLGQNHPYAVTLLPGQSTLPIVPRQNGDGGRLGQGSTQADALRSGFGPSTPSSGRKTANWRPRIADSDFYAAVRAADGETVGSFDLVQDASTYVPATIDLAEAVSLLLVSHMCHLTVPAVLAGWDKGLDGKKPHPLGREQPDSGGPSLLRLAEDALRRDCVSKVGQAASVAALLARLRQAERFRSLMVDTGGRAGAGLQVVPPQLQEIITGPLRMPDILARLHTPLFHWLRIHLSRADLVNDPLTFAAVVDVWLSVLTPWRARPRYKEKAHDVAAMRSNRYFDYAGVAVDLLEVKKREEAAKQAGKNRIPGLLSLNINLVDLMKDVRADPAYGALLRSTGDFGSDVLKHAQGDLHSEHMRPAMWAPYVRLHYAFYTHLMYIFLQRMRQADFSGDVWSRDAVPSMLTRDAKPGAAPPGPVLLETLERVLDVYEKDLVNIIEATQPEVEVLFPLAVSHAHSQGTGAQSYVSSPQHFMGASASLTGQAEATGARVQLLAHVAMLNLPKEVRACNLFPSRQALQVEADTVVRRLQAAMDSTSMGPAPPIGPSGGRLAWLPGAAVLPCRIPEIPVPVGCQVSQGSGAEENPLPWEAVRSSWSEAVDFFLYPILFILSALGYYTGLSANRACAHLVVRAAIEMIVNILESMSLSAIDATKELQGVAGNVFGKGDGTTSQVGIWARPPVYRLGDRLQLACDRAMLAFDTRALQDLPAPPSHQWKWRSKPPTWVDGIRKSVWGAVDWMFLRNNTYYSHEAQAAYASHGQTAVPVPLARMRLDARDAHDDSRGRWESKPMVWLTRVGSALLRNLALALLTAAMYMLRPAWLLIALTTRREAGPLVLPLNVVNVISGLMQGNFLRRLGMADVRILPFWLAYVAVAIVVGVRPALVIFIALFVVLRFCAE